uniref:Uncharacterized protein n=1 Tax=Tetraselmis sp. GSL018 TaxID=582737 RepID=A0A061S1Q4_9CHLO|mmetsp:Transcript_15237/g.36259  ORF Transcript_15237/g.36259 Transcript_15237/m.36259 type:complete len:244 (-) Transcript_15237:136-867(-)
MTVGLIRRAPSFFLWSNLPRVVSSNFVQELRGAEPETSTSSPEFEFAISSFASFPVNFQRLGSSQGFVPWKALCRGFARLPFKPPQGQAPKRPKQNQPQMEEDSETRLVAEKMTPAEMTNSLYLPWERRQFEGGKLKWWEKTYWTIFLLAIGGLVVSRMYNPWVNTDGAEYDAVLEERRRGDSRAVLLGRSFLTDEDPFEGLSPEEIESYVKQHTGAAGDDPFEGMTPAEIDEYLSANPGAGL